MDIEALELSIRTYNCLKRRGINTVEHLMSIPDEDLEHIFAIGVNGLAEVKEKLKIRYTNADHIRSMSDEELANERISYRDDWGDYLADDGRFYYDRDEAIKAELDWLKQPYKENK